MSTKAFTLLFLALPTDAREILPLHYQVYLSDTLYTKAATPSPEEAFIDANLPGILIRFSNPEILAAKFVCLQPGDYCWVRSLECSCFGTRYQDSRGTGEQERQG